MIINEPCTTATMDGHHWVRRRDGAYCVLCGKHVSEQKSNVFFVVQTEEPEEPIK